MDASLRRIRQCRGAAMAAALALLGPGSGLMAQQDRGAATGAQVALPSSLKLDYAIRDGALQACKVRGTTGDADVDIAICALLQRCVAAGATTDQAAMTCLEPHYNRLAEMVGAGLLTALDETPSADGAAPDDAEALAATPPPDGDIVVTARRTPRPGLWLISERGRRTMYAQNNMTFTLPPRNWRRCIRRGDLAAVVAEMMRYDRRGVATSATSGPCGWDVKVEEAGLRGGQRCTIQGGMLSGRMTGAVSDTRFEVEKETRYRQLGQSTALQRERRRVMEEFGELVAGTDDEIYPRLPARDLRRIPESVRDASQDNLDEVVVTGFRVGACPAGLGDGGEATGRTGRE